MLKVSFISTIDHNVGDDFVREGIVYLLEKLFGPIQQYLIHKHIPLIARPEWEWFYRSGLSRAFDKIPGVSGLGIANYIDRLPLNKNSDKILNCDLLVQSGAPVLWLHEVGNCAKNEWFESLVRRRWCRIREKVPFFNIGGGTCQEYHSDGTEFSSASDVLEYIREFYDYCALTTVRDKLTQKIMNFVNASPLLLPCPSIFARMRFRIKARTPSYVALNYMPGGGHYRFAQDINELKWERTFVEFANRLAREEKCSIVCHNQSELRAARRLFPDFATFYSPRYADYIDFYAEAKYGIFNRVHGAFILGSFGRPALVVGSDSRAKMSEMIGLRNICVNDVTGDILMNEVAELQQKLTTYSDRMIDILKHVEEDYQSAIKLAFSAC